MSGRPDQKKIANRLLIVPFPERWAARERLRRGQPLWGGSVFMTYSKPADQENAGWTARESEPKSDVMGLPPDKLGLAYAALGVERTATVDEVNAAFKKIAFEHHPDRGGDEEKFKSASVARDIVLAYLKDGTLP